MSEPTTTFDRVRTIIAEHLCVEVDKVTPEATIQEDLGADSLDNVELCMAFEEEFGIDITDDQCDKLNTVGEWVTQIDLNLAKRENG